jgi:hypothetical protein
VGNFPRTYVVALSPQQPRQAEPPPPPPPPRQQPQQGADGETAAAQPPTAEGASKSVAPRVYVAAHSYDPQDVSAGCLSLDVGDEISVIDSSREDWWIGFKVSDPAKATGSFPKAYVTPVGCHPARTTTGRPDRPPRPLRPTLVAGDTVVAGAEQSSSLASSMSVVEESGTGGQMAEVGSSGLALVPTAETPREDLQVRADAAAAAAVVAAAEVDRVAARAKQLLLDLSQADIGVREALCRAYDELQQIQEGVPPPASPLAPAVRPGAAAPASLLPRMQSAGLRGLKAPPSPTSSVEAGSSPSFSPRLPVKLQSEIARFSMASHAAIHFRAQKTKGFLGIFGRRLLTNDEIAAHSSEMIEQPLLATTPKSLQRQAIDNFAQVMIWMDERRLHESGGSMPSLSSSAAGLGPLRPAWGPTQWEAAAAVLRLAVEHEVELTDEIYLQLVKQSFTNPSAPRRTRGLGLLLLLGCVTRPSEAVCESLLATASGLASGHDFSRPLGRSGTVDSHHRSFYGGATDDDADSCRSGHTALLAQALIRQLQSPGEDSMSAVPLLPAGGGDGLSDTAIRLACQTVLPNVLGVELEALLMRERLLRGKVCAQVPPILGQLIDIVRSRGGHDLQGIFRVTAERDRIDALLAHFDRGGDRAPLMDDSAAEHTDFARTASSTGWMVGGNPSVAATALKQWLGSLPEPLFPFALYREAIDSYRDQQAVRVAVLATDALSCQHRSLIPCTAQVKALCDKLPPTHRATLCALMQYLYTLSKCEANTSMGPSNLAVRWHYAACHGSRARITHGM